MLNDWRTECIIPSRVVDTLPEARTRMLTWLGHNPEQRAKVNRGLRAIAASESGSNEVVDVAGLVLDVRRAGSMRPTIVKADADSLSPAGTEPGRRSPSIILLAECGFLAGIGQDPGDGVPDRIRSRLPDILTAPNGSDLNGVTIGIRVVVPRAYGLERAVWEVPITVGRASYRVQYVRVGWDDYVVRAIRPSADPRDKGLGWVEDFCTACYLPLAERAPDRALGLALIELVLAESGQRARVTRDQIRRGYAKNHEDRHLLRTVAVRLMTHVGLPHTVMSDLLSGRPRDELELMLEPQLLWIERRAAYYVNRLAAVVDRWRREPWPGFRAEPQDPGVR